MCYESLSFVFVFFKVKFIFLFLGKAEALFFFFFLSRSRRTHVLLLILNVYVSIFWVFLWLFSLIFPLFFLFLVFCVIFHMTVWINYMIREFLIGALWSLDRVKSICANINQVVGILRSREWYNRVRITTEDRSVQICLSPVLNSLWFFVCV